MNYQEYLKISEAGSWSLDKHICWEDFSEDNEVSERVLSLLYDAAIIESFAPMFVMDGLELWHLDIDESAIVSIQFQDEYRHYFAIQKYLALHNRAVPEREVVRLRTLKHVSPQNKLRYLANYFISEHFTAMFYLQLLDLTTEPVLRQVLTFIMKDEFRHSNVFYGLLAKHFKANPEAVRESILEEAIDFKHFGLDVIDGHMPQVKTNDFESLRQLDRKIHSLIGVSIVDYKKRQLAGA